MRYNAVLESTIHHDITALIHAHVGVTEQTFGMFGQKLVIGIVFVQAARTFVGQPRGQIGYWQHFGYVVAIEFA